MLKPSASTLQGQRPRWGQRVFGLRGFSLLELMVTLAVLGLLLAAAAPTFGAWISNSRVRAVNENLQNGLRLAQAEAIRRSRVVVFALTNDAPSATATAVANGRSWAVFSVGLLDDEDLEFVQGGELGSAAAGVTVTGPASVCFGLSGRLVDPPAATGVDGEACDGTSAEFDVKRDGADRELRTLVNLAGQVRVCDPAKTQSATQPDGCPEE